MSEEDQTNKAADSERNSAPDRSSERSSERGERELSGGRRDRSREMLREEIARNFDNETRRTGGKPRDWEPDGRPAREAKEAAAEKPRTASSEPGTSGTAPGTSAAAIDTSAPPSAWTSAAKKEWERLPPAVQAAVAKREIDASRGVEQLKQKYAQEDAAWAPHDPDIRQFGKSRAETVTQLMNWFSALSRDPVNAFPALVKSMGAEQALLQHAQRQQQGGAPAQQTNGGALDPRAVQQYVDQRVGTLEQQLMEHQQQKTNDILESWSRDKPHYSKVRLMMSRLLMPNPATGESIIPLKNGSVDLDSAYAESLKLVPEVWAAVQAEQRAAERKAESERAQRARYSSSSLRPASPGSNSNTSGAKKRGGPTSVRQSLEAAMDELAGR